MAFASQELPLFVVDAIASSVFHGNPAAVVPIGAAPFPPDDVLQAVANLSFSWLALAGLNEWALAFAISAENFTSAIGTVIFVAYLSALCQNPLHTATQYALLTALARKPNEVLSREEIAEALGMDVSGERAIDVQVVRLRRKIEADPREPRFLHTVRGRGYILKPGA